MPPAWKTLKGVTFTPVTRSAPHPVLKWDLEAFMTKVNWY